MVVFIIILKRYIALMITTHDIVYIPLYHNENDENYASTPKCLIKYQNYQCDDSRMNCWVNYAHKL